MLNKKKIKVALVVWVCFLAFITAGIVYLREWVLLNLQGISPVYAAMLCAVLFWIICPVLIGESFFSARRFARIKESLCLSSYATVCFVFPLFVLLLTTPQFISSALTSLVLLGTFILFNIACYYRLRHYSFVSALFFLGGGYWLYYMFRQVDYTIRGTSVNSTEFSFPAQLSIFWYSRTQENLPEALLLAGCMILVSVLLLLINRAAD